MFEWYRLIELYIHFQLVLEYENSIMISYPDKNILMELILI